VLLVILMKFVSEFSYGMARFIISSNRSYVVHVGFIYARNQFCRYELPRLTMIDFSFVGVIYRT